MAEILIPFGGEFLALSQEQFWDARQRARKLMVHPEHLETAKNPERLRTLDLRQAAELLHMNREALRQKAKAGLIPGAKTGKRWTFIEADLVAYLRSQYPAKRQAAQAAPRKEVIRCRYDADKKSGGSISEHQTDDEYAAALGRRTE